MWSGAPLRLLVQSNLIPLHHRKGACPLCGGWRLGGGKARGVGGLLRFEVGVTPDDLDEIAKRKDEGYAADKVAHEGECRKGPGDGAADGCHGIAVLFVPDHARDRGARKGRGDQRDTDYGTQ